jgi:hypothetical protein
MQALLIFFFSFFSCAALLYLHLPFTSLFSWLKVLQNQNTIQMNQQISYQSDTDSMLNIVQLIWQSKPI